MIVDTIVKAIDHQLDRNAKAARAGIDVAKSQNGGAANVTPSTSVGSGISSGSNEGSGDQAVEQAVAKSQSEGGLPNATDTSGQQGDDSDSGVAIKSAEADDGDTGSADSSVGSVGGGNIAGSSADSAVDAAGGGNIAGSSADSAVDAAGDMGGDVMSDERLKAKECASSVIGKWHKKGKILSDASAKTSENVSTKTDNKESKASGAWETVSNKMAGVGQAFGQGGRDIAAMVNGSKASADVKTQEPTVKETAPADTETSKKAAEDIEGKSWKDKFKEKATAVGKALTR